MIMKSIFELDWLLIDSVIILLLVLFLIAVRLFKQFSRWRLSPSNLELGAEKNPITLQDINLNNKRLILKGYKLIKNPIAKGKSEKPLIIFFQSNFQTEFLSVLSEGLASYGFNILHLQFKIKPPFNAIDIITQIQKDSYDILSALLDHLLQKGGIENKKYVAIKFGKSNLPYESILKDPKNLGVLLLNPKYRGMLVNKISIESIIRSKKTLLIFNYIPFLLFKRRYPELFLKNGFNNLSVIKKAYFSFKNYETILLGLLIRFIHHRMRGMNFK